jgi:hypothetical protein
MAQARQGRPAVVVWLQCWGMLLGDDDPQDGEEEAVEGRHGYSFRWLF